MKTSMLDGIFPIQSWCSTSGTSQSRHILMRYIEYVFGISPHISDWSINSYIYIYIYTIKHIYVYTLSISPCIHICIYIVYMYIHSTYIYIYIYVYIYICIIYLVYPPCSHIASISFPDFPPKKDLRSQLAQPSAGGWDLQAQPPRGYSAHRGSWVHSEHRGPTWHGLPSYGKVAI